MSSKIINSILTKEDQHLLLDELYLLEESLYKTNDGNWNEVLNSKLRKPIAVIIEEETSDAVIDKIKYLREIIDTIRNMGTVKLSIAFNPTRDFVLQVSNWVKKNIGENLILDIIIDKNIIGGAIISFNGKYIDLSLDLIWKNFWEEKSDELLSTFGLK